MFESLDSLFKKTAAKKNLLGTFLHAEVVARANGIIAKHNPALIDSIRASHMAGDTLILTATSGTAAQEARFLIPELKKALSRHKPNPKSIRVELRPGNRC